MELTVTADWQETEPKLRYALWIADFGAAAWLAADGKWHWSIVDGKRDRYTR